jgi:hypothetical protein
MFESTQAGVYIGSGIICTQRPIIIIDLHGTHMHLARDLLASLIEEWIHSFDTDGLGLSKAFINLLRI